MHAKHVIDRKVGPGCKENCCYKCRTKINEDRRGELFSVMLVIGCFWNGCSMPSPNLDKVIFTNTFLIKCNRNFAEYFCLENLVLSFSATMHIKLYFLRLDTICMLTNFRMTKDFCRSVTFHSYKLVSEHQVVLEAEKHTNINLENQVIHFGNFPP